jgi:hypothetical protein
LSEDAFVPGPDAKPMNAAGEASLDAMTELGSERRLAGAAGPDQRDARRMASEQSAERRDLGRTTDQALRPRGERLVNHPVGES